MYNLKIAWNRLCRGKIYSVINIGGLAIGMAAAMIIMLWVYHQWSYDRFHAKDKYLYKLWCYDDTNGNFPNVSYSIGPSLLAEYAGFANMTRYSENEVPLKLTGEDGYNFEFTSKNDNIVVVASADTSFLNMFSFPLLQGDASTALTDPYSMVITQSVAQHMFGNKDPMGETILVLGVMNFKITGILADLPDNTDFRFEILVPYSRGNADESWWYPSGNSSFGNRTFVELSPDVDVKTVSASIRDIIAKHTDGRVATETYLQHISKWHLYNQVERGISVGGRIETLRMFSLIALLILAIACINFINLRTAQSSKYNKETGMRKLFGAHRSGLIGNFLGESIMITFLSGAIAMFLLFASLPYFNALTGEQISLNFESFWFWIVIILFIVFTGVLAGSYPAFYLSSFLPIKVLKGVFNNGRSLVTPRKVLIVTQFVFAIILIVSTWTIHRQIQYVQGRDIGYDKSRLVSFQVDEQSRHTRALLRRELLETGVAESVSINFASMFESESLADNLRWRGKDPITPITFESNSAEADWTKTTGVQIIQGRDIDTREYPNDSTAMLLNEAAVKAMGFDDPIGEIVYIGNVPYHVIGVVKDFVLESPFDPIRPMYISGPVGSAYNNINVKLSAQGSLSENLKKMEQIFRKYNPGEVCRYWIVDEMYARHFDKEQRIRLLITWFTGLAIFISCLGLFGLSAYMAENRRKEIGIRKVYGASIKNVITLLSNEFVTLVLVALIIAIPVSWFIMHQWLQGYAYRTNLPWYLFVTVGGLTIGIALLTVCGQALRAAMADPIKTIMNGE
jgi:ABC-type antimicrobial peptide transport system permease subunit